MSANIVPISPDSENKDFRECTPGPWVVGWGNGLTGPTTPVFGGPCCGGKEWPILPVSRGRETIAIVPAQEQQPEAMEANARLIAAAPELAVKAQKFDQIITDARFKFDFWSKLAHQDDKKSTRPIQKYYEGCAHVAAEILWYAGEKPVCPCGGCTQHRMTEKDGVKS